MAYSEQGRQNAISMSVALNNACQLWGGIFKFSGNVDDEMKASIEQGVIETAERFYAWLTQEKCAEMKLITQTLNIEGEALAKKLVDEVINKPKKEG